MHGIIFLFIWLSFAGYGYWIAMIKRRSPGEGIFLGLLFGPVGCLVEATLRERTAEEVEADRLRRQEAAEARLEQEKQYQAAFQAEVIRQRQAARARAEAARKRRADAFEHCSDWFDQTILKFGWYKALPEVAQPIVLGLMIALPVVIVIILVMKE